MNTQPETVLLPLDAIDDSDRLRVVDPDYVQLLAAAMDEHAAQHGGTGLRTPIDVNKADKKGRHKLIAGAHRIAAFRLRGLTEIPAIVISANKLQAQLLEIDENLMRRELTPLDRATFLAKRKEVYEALHPETKHGGDRVSEQVAKSGDLVSRFTADIASKLDISERSVQLAVTRFKRIAPDVRERIATTWLARKGAMLDAIAKQEPAMQRAIVSQLLAAEGAPKTVQAALDRINGVTAPAAKPEDEQRYDALIKAWDRAGQRVRDRFVDFLAAQGVVVSAAAEPEEKLGSFARAVQAQMRASQGEAA